MKLGFKIRALHLLHVSAYTGWRWTSALGFGELIEVDLTPEIDHIRVDVTARQDRAAYGRALFDLSGKNRTNVALVLEFMDSRLRS